MKRRLIYITTFISIIFLIPDVNARSINVSKDSGVYISLNWGISIPLGNFKSSEYALGGYAMNGYGGNIEIEHPIKPGWVGLAFEMGYYVNPFNLSAYKNVMYPLFNQYPTWQYTIIDASLYKEIPILAGMFFESTFKKFTIEFNSMIGFDIITTASVNAVESGTKIIIGFHPELFIPSQATNAFFCYSGEASIRYALSKHISVRANASYLNDFYAKYPYFSNWVPYIPLSQLHLELGVAYHI